jgi:superoxide reductase
VKRRGCYVSGVNTEITDRLKELIEDAVEEYNKYRSPEANAKIVRIEKHCFQVDFTGSFCRTCGFYDYFDDLRIILENKGLRTRITEIEEKDDGALVTFTIV